MANAILITGGSGLIGRELVQHFAASGWQVGVTTRKLENVEHIKDRLPTEISKRIFAIEADLLDLEFARNIVVGLKENKLLPNVLVNNAVDYSTWLLESNGKPTAENWVKTFQTQIVAPYELTSMLAELDDSPLESVINIGSMYGCVARHPKLYDDPLMESPIQYGVSKAAFAHLTKELAVRLAPAIRVNMVSYGGVDGRVDEAFKERYRDYCPRGTMLEPKETCGVIEFLARADMSSGMTGENVHLDGGWTAW